MDYLDNTTSIYSRYVSLSSGSFLNEEMAAAQQIPSRTHISRIGIGERKAIVSEQFRDIMSVDGIVFMLPPFHPFDIESMSQVTGDVEFLQSVDEPVPKRSRT